MFFFFIKFSMPSRPSLLLLGEFDEGTSDGVLGLAGLTYQTKGLPLAHFLINASSAFISSRRALAAVVSIHSASSDEVEGI